MIVRSVLLYVVDGLYTAPFRSTWERNEPIYFDENTTRPKLPILTNFYLSAEGQGLRSTDQIFQKDQIIEYWCKLDLCNIQFVLQPITEAVQVEYDLSPISQRLNRILSTRTTAKSATRSRASTVLNTFKSTALSQSTRLTTYTSTRRPSTTTRTTKMMSTTVNKISTIRRTSMRLVELTSLSDERLTMSLSGSNAAVVSSLAVSSKSGMVWLMFLLVRLAWHR